ncbi:aldehyde:ferredoxin oxidoreductase [Candidatus Bipolaricaulota bacterium]|nr:aldehyde:ferredoxin oxidoreductase [Candidatus Bipolaricaulota bacterium]
MPADRFGRVLHVDLAKRRFEIRDRRDLFRESLGGAGAAIRLLEENGGLSAEPQDPGNPIVFAVGPLVGLYPMASKTVAMFVSPHNGRLGESHAGGRSAVSIRMAGYAAVVLTGASSTPVYLVIHDHGVEFRDASALWGLENSYTVGRVMREREPGSGARSILRIGRAGEVGVTYACVITETYRHFGRLGLGAVFGGKKLKGIVIVGRGRVPVADPKRYRAHYDLVFQAATRSKAMRKYHDLGTPINVLPLHELSALPTRNLREGSFEGAEAISGEAMAKRFLGRRLACAHCPVACVHLAALRTRHPHEPYFFSTAMLGYDYEPMYALGSMLGVADPEAMLRLMDEVEIQGLDAMSTGVVLAWGTEAVENGLVSLGELDGTALSWGDADAYRAAIRKIVERPTDLYRAMARGVAYAASVYGGEGFALAFGGNEMPGYHTGPGGYLTFLTGSRHSHLDSAGYGIDQSALGEGELPPPEEMIRQLFREEAWRQVLASLVVCFFARGIYTPDVVCEALAIADEGLFTDESSLRRIGQDALARKQRFNEVKGYDLTESNMPERIFETRTPWGKLDRGYMRTALIAASELWGHVDEPREHADTSSG